MIKTTFASLAATAREFAAYLRRPALLAPGGLRAGDSRRVWLGMLALHLAGLAVIMPLIGAWQRLMQLPDPDAFGKISPALLPWLVVAIAPPIEEMLFRGWQSGRPRALWLLGAVLALVGVSLIGKASMGPLVPGLAALGVLLAAPIGWFLLRRKQAPAWFTAWFPAFFFLAAAVFAVLHALNYPHLSLALLPMVLPQAWAGLTLGFVRQRVGLIGSILVHAGSNGLFLALATLG